MFWICFQRFKAGDFDVHGKEPVQPEKFKDDELDTLLSIKIGVEHKKSSLAIALNITHQAISKRLRAFEMIQKLGHWVPQ